MFKVVEYLVEKLEEYGEELPEDVLEEIEDIQAGEIYDDRGTLFIHFPIWHSKVFPHEFF